VLSRGKNGEKVFRKNVFGQTLFVGSNPERPFIPAFLTDNPYLDVDEYLKNLEELDPVTRNQLKGGDWDVAADGRFKQEWSRYYSVAGSRITLTRNGQRKSYRIDECRRFTIIDPATSSAEGPGDKTNLRQEMPSWTVIGTFLLTPDGHLLVWDWWRMQEEVDVVIKAIKQTYTRHEPCFIGLELSPISTHLYQALTRIGMPLSPLLTGGKDKLARATDIITRMEQGRVWFPDWSPPWLEALQQELFTWTAHPYEEDDQIDVMAYAGMWVSRNSAVTADERVWTSNPLAMEDMTPGSC
jgi:predicted phage terminase large subunit-like protein